MKAQVRHPREYVRQYILSQPRYTTRYQHILFPHRVTVDPVYPRSVAIVEMPCDIKLTGPRIYWAASRFSHRLPIHSPDMLGFFAVLSFGKSLKKLQTSIAFSGNEVFLIYHKWLCFITRGGKKIFHPSPPPLHSYESRVIHVKQQLLFADHANLRTIFRGLTIE